MKLETGDMFYTATSLYYLVVEILEGGNNAKVIPLNGYGDIDNCSVIVWTRTIRIENGFRKVVS